MDLLSALDNIPPKEYMMKQPGCRVSEQGRRMMGRSHADGQDGVTVTTEPSMEDEPDLSHPDFSRLREGLIE